MYNKSYIIYMHFMSLKKNAKSCIKQNMRLTI